MQIGRLNIGWKKNVDVETNTKYGRNFYSLNEADLSRYLQAIWGKYSDTNLIELFHSVPEIFAPVHAIAFRVAGANWQLKKKQNDEVVYDNAYINNLLSKPNPLQNFQELMYEAEVYEIVTGKNFMYANIPDTMAVDYKNIATLMNLFADVVDIQTDVNVKLLSATTIADIIKAYKVSDGATYLTIKPEKVLYTRRIDLYYSDRKLKGLSPLLSAQKAICNLLAVYEARNVIYTKRGALGIMVSKKGDASGLVPLNPSEKKELLKDFDSSYGLTNGKSPIAITNLPVEYIRIAMSLQELQPFTETLADAMAICSVLGVDTDLMPSDKGATFENKKQAERALYQNVVIPKAKNWAQSLTTFWGLDKWGFYLDATFDHVEVLQENKKEKSDVDWRNNETARVRFLYGVITLNEWLTSCGYEEVNNALYNKRVMEMSEEELTQVKAVLAMKSVQTTQGNENSSQQQETQPSTGK